MNDMKTLSYLFATLITSLFFSLNAYSQELTAQQKDKITSEIAMAFEQNVKAAESFNANALADCVDDSLKAGFIVGGVFFGSFNEVMADFKKKAVGCKSQKMDVTNKRITVLGKESALLVASGNYSLYLEDGRTLTGKFAWSIVYSKVNGNWKIIHTYM